MAIAEVPTFEVPTFEPQSAPDETEKDRMVPTHLAGHLVVADFFEDRTSGREARSLASDLNTQGFIVQGDQLIIAGWETERMPASEIVRTRKSINRIADAVIFVGGVEIFPIYPEGFTTYDTKRRQGAIYPGRFVTIKSGVSPQDIERSREAQRQFSQLLDQVTDNATVETAMDNNPFTSEQYDRIKLILFGSKHTNSYLRKKLTPLSSLALDGQLIHV